MLKAAILVIASKMTWLPIIFCSMGRTHVLSSYSNSHRVSDTLAVIKMNRVSTGKMDEIFNAPPVAEINLKEKILQTKILLAVMRGLLIGDFVVLVLA